jgi:hypothetical protein
MQQSPNRHKEERIFDEKSDASHHKRLHFHSPQRWACWRILLTQTEAPMQDPNCCQQESAFYKVMVVPRLLLGGQSQ